MQIESRLFSVSPMYISWLLKVVSVTVALYTTHLARHLPLSGQELFLPTVTHFAILS